MTVKSLVTPKAAAQHTRVGLGFQQQEVIAFTTVFATTLFANVNAA
jgi:hypothetical protein